MALEDGSRCGHARRHSHALPSAQRCYVRTAARTARVHARPRTASPTHGIADAANAPARCCSAAPPTARRSDGFGSDSGDRRRRAVAVACCGRSSSRSAHCRRGRSSARMPQRRLRVSDGHGPTTSRLRRRRRPHVLWSRRRVGRRLLFGRRRWTSSRAGLTTSCWSCSSRRISLPTRNSLTRTNTYSRVRTCIHEQFPMLARADTAAQLVASVGVPHTLALVSPT